VTLTGTGGSGKTRLAIEVASRVSDDFEDGACWVELAALVDEVLVPQAVATALGLYEAQTQDIVQTLVTYLRDKTLLLLIDNCEHLVVACAQLVERLLLNCPALKILTTSRETLDIPGESIFVVPPLALPEPKPWRDPESAKGALNDYQQSEAVHLFSERASAASPSFGLSIENGPWVAEICRRLDGMPLAIELAAVRVRSLSPRQIYERLQDRFALLTGGSRTAPPRQQTLAATLDWSYDLLSAEEQTVLRRLSVFAGGWTLQAAETICSGGGIETGDVLDLLTDLVSKSFVVRDKATEDARFGMLETVREYAKKHLIESDEQAAVRQKHGATFLRMAQETVKDESMLSWPGEPAAVRVLDLEHDNFRAVLRWSTTNDPETGVHLSARLAQFWQQRGYLNEGRKWFQTFLLLGDKLSKPTRAVALFHAGYLNLYAGEIERADSFLNEALELYRQLNDKSGIAWQHVWLGWTKLAQRDYLQAIEFGKKGAEIHREIGDAFGIAVALAPIGEAQYLQGNYEESKQVIKESFTLLRERGILFAAGRRLTRLGQIERRQGDLDQATQLIQEGLTNCSQAGDYSGAAMALAGLAAVAESQGKSRRAARLLGAVAGLQEKSGAVLWFFDRLEYKRTQENVQAQLDSNVNPALVKEGWQMTLEEMVEFAVSAGGNQEAEPVDDNVQGGLTKREREVASLIARGRSNREIAQEMTVSEKTVETYVTRILGKLGFESRVQVALWAAEKKSGLSRAE
jgi:non-specific serine/threonine protein kinase